MGGLRRGRGKGGRGSWYKYFRGHLLHLGVPFVMQPEQNRDVSTLSALYNGQPRGSYSHGDLSHTAQQEQDPW